MKKKIWIPIACVLLLLLILFVPIPMQMRDGGTKVYSALTYKAVNWRRIYSDGIYTENKVYFGADAHKSLDELFEREEENITNTVVGRYLETNDSIVTVTALLSEFESTREYFLKFDVSELPIIETESGKLIKVKYKGGISEDGEIDAVEWSVYEHTRTDEYTDNWLDEVTKKPAENISFSDIQIILIYKDCFLASAYYDNDYIPVKINGSISEDWCENDYAECTYENLYQDASGKLECDLLTIGASNSRPDVYDKPVIYLYPETKTDVTVSLDYDGKLTCTYPEYKNGWSVTASPDGTLTDANGQTYNYLYWEGESDAGFDFSEGFCVKGEDTAAFLEDALARLGLERREANEFIIYWLPMMQNNEYNVISFQKESYTEMAKLTISPTPDTLIRVFMAWRGSDEYVDIPPQTLTAPERRGFTAVEWGGSEVK